MAYFVNLYGSHPKNGNDDCWTGEEYPTLDAAKQAASDLKAAGFSKQTIRDTEWIEIDGPDHNSCSRNPGFYPDRDKDDAKEWQREIANEAGMMGGVSAYNDAMGYDSEEYDPDVHDRYY